MAAGFAAGCVRAGRDRASGYYETLLVSSGSVHPWMAQRVLRTYHETSAFTVSDNIFSMR